MLCRTVKIWKKLNIRYAADEPQLKHFFSRKLKRLQKDNASLLSNYTDYNYLREYCANLMVERLSDFKYKFPIICDIGCHGGEMKHALLKKREFEHIIECDRSLGMLELTKKNNNNIPSSQVLVDEELLPFKDESFDLITSCLYLHWTNEVELALKEVRRCLKPDGYFSGCLFGNLSLQELKESFYSTELTIFNGASPRVSPLPSCSEVAWLLQECDFTIAHVDHRTEYFEFKDLKELLKHIRGMGEQAAFDGNPPNFSKSLLKELQYTYESKLRSDNDTIIATANIIFFGGWSHAMTQRQPLLPSSPQTNLKDLFDPIKREEILSTVEKKEK